MNSRVLLLCFTALNFVLYSTRAIAAGYMQNQFAFETWDIDKRTWGAARENPITPVLVQTTLILSMIGIASSYASLLHSCEWTQASRLIAIAMNVMALMLDIMTVGYGASQRQVGNFNNYFVRREARFLAWAAVIQMFIQFGNINRIHASRYVLKDHTPGANGTTRSDGSGGPAAGRDDDDDDDDDDSQV